MAEQLPHSRGSTPSLVPHKRALGLEDEQHLPAVSSPLNPDPGAVRARKPGATREQREKKDSLKKREAKGTDNTRAGTPDSQGQARKTKKEPSKSKGLGLFRYQVPPPRQDDFHAAAPPVLASLNPPLMVAGRQFYEATEHVFNRKGYRYTRRVIDPAFPHSQYNRSTETAPFGARFDWEDSSSNILFADDAKSVTVEKGFRMSRANICAREGRWYWECKVLRGISSSSNPTPVNSKGPGPHVRLGFSRREASLDAPVGFDAYSYSLRDVAGQKVHMSRPKDFMPPGEQIEEGDVIGLEIKLPSLSLHRKVVDGSYNKAVDVADELDLQGEAPDIIRDRLPIRYRSHLLYETIEYHSAKDLEDLFHPAPVVAAMSRPLSEPHPNHESVHLRTLPFSYIKIYKNGKLIGNAFEELLAFLPLASKPQNQRDARDGLDDGALGYYPSVSCFTGGAAEANFGPDFWFPPPEMSQSEDSLMAGGEDVMDRPTTSRLRPLSERYTEQIAEDVMYDIIDEVDLWAQDGGTTDEHAEPDSSVLKPVTRPIVGAMLGATGPSGKTGEMKEVVQEEE